MIIMDLPRDCHVFAMGLQRDCYGIAAGLLWDGHVITRVLRMAT